MSRSERFPGFAGQCGPPLAGFAVSGALISAERVDVHRAVNRLDNLPTLIQKVIRVHAECCATQGNGARRYSSLCRNGICVGQEGDIRLDYCS